MTKSEMDDLLQDWAKLNKELMTMDEEDVTQLMAHEKKNRARQRVLFRLYHRFSRLRATREKVELSGAVRG